MLNPLYDPVAKEIMGRDIKHPSNIYEYSMPNYDITTDTPLKFIGMDIETSKNGEIKLLGVYHNGKYYSYYHKDHDLLRIFCRWVKLAIYEKYIIVHWSKFDQNAIAKLFLSKLSKSQLKKSLEIYGKISIAYKNGEWETEPIASVTYDKLEFGISSVIDKKTLTIYMLNERSKYPMFISVIDMNSLYKTNLENATKNQKIEYTKMKEGFKHNGETYDYHVINWSLYEENKDYKKGCLKSNEMDSRAVKELADKFIDNFHRVWGKYPKYIFSSGSLAKTTLSCELNKEDFESLNIIKLFESLGYNDNDETKAILDELHIISCEAYSGGLFELFSIGKGPVYMADITACYPFAISKLKDLRNMKVIKGKGPIPRPKANEIIFIRGWVNMPKGAIHSLNCHNPDNPTTVFRPVGVFKTSYIYEERELAISQGAKFFNEEYYIISTDNKPSPLAIASNNLFKMRQKYIKNKDIAQSIIKDSNNSCYGITIEGILRYKLIDGKVKSEGYRAGQLYNPIYACLITAYCRVLLCETMIKIKANGGLLVQANTDSIHWSGNKEDLPKDFNSIIGPSGWREEKTLGYFEEPVLYKNFISLATGRYGGFNTKKQRHETKLRSYIIEDNGHYLLDLLEEYEDLPYCQSIPLTARTMITIKLSKVRTELNLEDTLRIEDIEKDLKLISQTYKCSTPLANIDNPIPAILNGFNETSSLEAERFIMKPINWDIELVREITLNKSKAIPTKKTIERQKTRERVKRYRANLTPEQIEEKRKKDREFKRKNKKYRRG